MTNFDVFRKGASLTDRGYAIPDKDSLTIADAVKIIYQKARSHPGDCIKGCLAKDICIANVGDCDSTIREYLESEAT